MVGPAGFISSRRKIPSVAYRTHTHTHRLIYFLCNHNFNRLFIVIGPSFITRATRHRVRPHFGHTFLYTPNPLIDFCVLKFWCVVKGSSDHIRCSTQTNVAHLCARIKTWLNKRSETGTRGNGSSRMTRTKRRVGWERLVETSKGSSQISFLADEFIWETSVTGRTINPRIIIRLRRIINVSVCSIYLCLFISFIVCYFTSVLFPIN